MDLTIFVISFNTRELTLRCIESVQRETQDLDFELIVVDNASADGSAAAIRERFPDVHLIESEQNLGFARANNLAAQRARGEYLLLLNPDTEVLDQAVQKLVAFARARGGAGVFGGRTYHADGSLNPASCWGAATPWSSFSRGIGLAALFPRNPLFDPESLGRWPRDTVREVDIISGCFLLLRRDLWERLGGFDPQFFMYGEDADLCLRARALGYPSVVCPDAKIVHHAGASEPLRSGKMLRLFRAKAQLFASHWSPGAARFGRWSLSLWCLTRLTATFGARWLRPRYRDTYATWREIWRGRAAWLDLGPERSGHGRRSGEPRAAPEP